MLRFHGLHKKSVVFFFIGNLWYNSGFSDFYNLVYCHYNKLVSNGAYITIHVLGKGNDVKWRREIFFKDNL